MDPARPRNDTLAVESALAAYLKANGAPTRPFVWVRNASSGRRLATAAARSSYNAAKSRAQAEGAGRKAVRRIASAAARAAAADPGGTLWAGDANDPNTWRNAWRAARIGSQATSDDAWLIVRMAAWKSICFAARVDGAQAGFCGAVDALARTSFGTSVNVERSLPLFEAFEAGLFACWIMPDQVLCVPQPMLALDAGRLHSAVGPAVSWPDESYYFWRGSHVPAWMIEEPERIGITTIRCERNQERRRDMVEIYGRSRYLRETGARVVHHDEYGVLWEAEGAEDERWRFVEVENGTPEPDGSRRVYTLDVTGAAEVLGWPIETARAAVAATYGLREEEYRPEIRT